MQEITVVGRIYQVDEDKFTYVDFMSLRILHASGNSEAFSLYCDSIMSRMLGSEVFASIPLHHFQFVVDAILHILMEIMETTFINRSQDDMNEFLRSIVDEEDS
jgi:hypothetical protein